MINYTLIRSKKDIVFPMVVRLAISLVSRRISKLPETSNISDLNRKIEICAERCILFSAFETSLAYFNMSMFDASNRKYRCAVRYLVSVDGGVVL